MKRKENEQKKNTVIKFTFVLILSIQLIFRAIFCFVFAFLLLLFVWIHARSRIRSTMLWTQEENSFAHYNRAHTHSHIVQNAQHILYLSSFAAITNGKIRHQFFTRTARPFSNVQFVNYIAYQRFPLCFTFFFLLFFFFFSSFGAVFAFVFFCLGSFRFFIRWNRIFLRLCRTTPQSLICTNFSFAISHFMISFLSYKSKKTYDG